MADPGRRITPTSPDFSDSSTAIDPSSPFSPVRHRPAYQRLASGLEDIRGDEEGEDIADTFHAGTPQSGLGIATSSSPKARRERRVSIARVPVGSKIRDSPSTSQTPGSGDPLISPPPPAVPYDSPDYNPKHGRTRSASSSVYEPGVDAPETEPLNQSAAASTRSNKTTPSAYDNDYNPGQGCPSAKGFYQGSSNWLAISIYILSVFSTAFSAAFLIIALRAPRWGHTIRSTGGGVSPSTANVLTQLFAKLTELAFVACFVTFLGQVLSRRAISKAARGVTLAEMTMRSWIMQPGTIVTHYETVRFAALTFLGALSLTVAIMAMLYTTAAQALVTPVLKFGPWEHQAMWGIIKTTFANPFYIEDNCQSPISVSPDGDAEYSATYVGTTCLAISYAAQGFYNYQQYLTNWAAMTDAGNGTTDQRYRPQGFGLFNENTTVNASWIQIIDTKENSKKFKRIINNVTLAMPHSGVFQAARDRRSNVMQPEELDGIGTYNIHGALPSPYVNVLCANMNSTELVPLIYANQSNVTLNYTRDLPTQFTYNFNYSGFANLTTVVDDVFEFDETNRPPIFYKFPLPFNTILNNTGTWPQPYIYLIGQGGPDETARIPNSDTYFVCRVKAGMTTNCSTYYTAIGSGGTMAAHCEDPDEPMTYIKFNQSRQQTISSDWYNVATSAMNSMSLNSGVTDADAANSRMLTQFQLKDMEGLNPALPSPAEALAVLMGCTLLMSARDSPFVEFWNYSETTLTPGAYQSFPSLIQDQQYASGRTQSYQRLFYIPLFFIFFTNVFVLIYFVLNRGLVTDFSEPPNLFSIAVNSPPSELMGGSCGGGPMKEQYAVKWRVGREGEHLFMAGEKDLSSRTARFGRGVFRRREARASEDDGVELGNGGRRTLYAGFDDAPNRSKAKEAPLGRMYSKLAKRRSVL